jgi:hypothetical protein
MMDTGVRSGSMFSSLVSTLNRSIVKRMARDVSDATDGAITFSGTLKIFKKSIFWLIIDSLPYLLNLSIYALDGL